MPASLDVFLMRAHALPLPYLTSPAISFLVHLSPLAYLTLLRTSASTPSAPQPDLKLPKIDIPFGHLRSSISVHPPIAGATVASLILSNRRPASDDSMNMPQLTSRPSYTLLPADSFADNAFPQPLAVPQSPMTTPFSWVLDFTDGGKHRGVVMSQSRMREIELVVNPLSGISHMGSVPMMTFGTGSWLDLLVCVPSHRRRRLRLIEWALS